MQTIVSPAMVSRHSWLHSQCFLNGRIWICEVTSCFLVVWSFSLGVLMLQYSDSESNWSCWSHVNRRTHEHANMAHFNPWFHSLAALSYVIILLYQFFTDLFSSPTYVFFLLLLLLTRCLLFFRLPNLGMVCCCSSFCESVPWLSHALSLSHTDNKIGTQGCIRIAQATAVNLSMLSISVGGDESIHPFISTSIWLSLSHQGNHIPLEFRWVAFMTDMLDMNSELADIEKFQRTLLEFLVPTEQHPNSTPSQTQERALTHHTPAASSPLRMMQLVSHILADQIRRCKRRLHRGKYRHIHLVTQ